MDLLVAPGAQGGTSLAPRRSKPPTVLVVDRQPLFLQALRSLLSAPPLEAVTRVTTGSDEVARVAGEGDLDLVICDVLASPLNGRAVAATLADVAPGVPLILLGEVSELTSELSLLLEGAAGMLTKDAAPEQLIAGVSAVLAGHRAVAESLLEPILAMRSARPHGESRLTGQLSHAEREVLALLGEARSVPAIAKARGISQKTVRNHMASIYRKLELRNRAEAMLYAARNGMVVGAPAGNGEDRQRAEAAEA
jgi:DNA-binding NarL/FixJ family response regulator